MLYFLLPVGAKTAFRVKEKNYLSKEFTGSFSGLNVIASGLYGSASLIDALIEHFELKLEHLLKYEDKNSMYFSLESRVPFLDYRLVEKTLSLSPEFIIQDGVNKIILREAMKDILPQNILNRQDKIGFATPQQSWFSQNAFKKLIEEVINSQSFKQRGILDNNKVQNIYKSFLSGRKNISNEIWKWLHLELWFQRFIDNSF